MNNIMIRVQLHKYIDQIDEQNLKAVYALLEKELGSSFYDKATLELLNKRRDNHLKGISKSYIVKESMEIARASKK